VTSDAIVLLKDDHKEIRRLFREFQRAGDRAVKKKGRLVEKIIERLTVHTYVENKVMYLEVRSLLPELEDDVLESYEEHHVADVLCVELAVMALEAEHFGAKATVLIENVSHHIEEEEQDWFPKVRAGLGVSSFRTSGPGSRRPGARYREPLRSPAR
jgi:hemerythrin-like domain-containing protein